MKTRWAVVLSLSLSTVAIADAEAPPPSTSSTQLALDGDRLFKESKYREAAEALKQAYALDPSPVLMFNIARAYDQAGDLQSALDAYRGYTELLNADATVAKRAQLAIDRLTRLLARAEAERQLEAAERLRREADAEAEKQKEEQAAKEHAALAARAQERLDAVNQEVNRRRLVGAGVASAAVTAVGIGAAFGALASSERNTSARAATLQDRQAALARSNNQALASDASFGVALAAGVAFALVFPWSSLSDAHGSLQVVFAPTGVGISARF